MFVSARHIFVAQDRRQTAECPDTNGDKRILKRQGLIGTQRHVFFQELALCLPANAGADASESGSRDERAWEQTRTHLLPDSLTGIGSWGIDLKVLEADCNAERMASALESRALKIQRKSSLAVAPSQRKFTLRQHNHLLRRQHCSSLCSQSEGHEHVANMTNALGHDFVGFSARAWPPQYSPPHFASKVSYSASPQGFVAPYYLTKRQIVLDFEHPTLQGRCRLSTNLLGVWILNILPRKSNFGPRKSGLRLQKSLTLHKQKKSPQSDVGLWGLLMLWCTFHSFLMSGMPGHAAL